MKCQQTLIEGRDFYPNQTLKNIIGYISASKGKNHDKYQVFMGKIDETEIHDVILGETLKEPVVSPAGFSYEKSSIESYIDSKKSPMQPNPLVEDPLNRNVSMTKSDLVPNRNLKLFINEWPIFYTGLLSPRTNLYT